MKQPKYILVIDQGTTSTRTIIFDNEANIISQSQKELKIFCPHNGWVEQDAEEIWESVVRTIQEAITLGKINPSLIAAIGITNQRETTVLWDKETGKPLYHALVWQSRQSQTICDDLIKDGLQDIFQEKTGLIINPYFSGSKIKWLIDNVQKVKNKIKAKQALFGTIDSFILYKLTNKTIHATDYTNASRTLIFNIKNKCWDEELLNYLDIPKDILPEVYPNNHVFGYATGLNELDEAFTKIPIATMIGDQQAALFGQCCFDEGSTKSTYGTGCFILMNTKEHIIHSKKGLLSTIAWGLDDKIEYALEGSVFVSGSAIQWLRDNVNFIKKSNECEKATTADNPSNGIYFVPAFVGLGTPYWDNDARGAIFGLTRATTKANITAAAVEASPYQAYDVMAVMKEETGYDIKYLGVDGGASVNNYMVQFQADLLNTKLIRPSCQETTSLGAYYLAGLTVGIFKDLKEIKSLHQIERTFESQIDEKTRLLRLKGWHQAIKATLKFKI